MPHGRTSFGTLRSGLSLAVLALAPGTAVLAADPLAASKKVLPSWYEAPAKHAIVGFVQRVVDPDSADFLEPGDRIALFDFDGTLWSEMPVSSQLLFAAERVRALADRHPEWKQTQPFKALLDGDLQSVAKGGEQVVVDVLVTAHAGMTTAEYEAAVTTWIETAKHPVTGRPLTEMVYQPMLELLDYLRENDFAVYVSSSGTVEFLRPWASRVFGVPPQNVIGSSVEVVFGERQGRPALLREGRVDIVNDKSGKVLLAHKYLGRPPRIVFANADVDLQLLRWTTSAEGPRLGLLLQHTDGVREWEYDRRSTVGRLDQALDEAFRSDWTVIQMKRDWRLVHPKPQPATASTAPATAAP